VPTSSRSRAAVTCKRGIGQPGRIGPAAHPSGCPDVSADCNQPRLPAERRRPACAGAYGFPDKGKGPSFAACLEFYNSKSCKKPDARSSRTSIWTPSPNRSASTLKLPLGGRDQLRDRDRDFSRLRRTDPQALLPPAPLPARFALRRSLPIPAQETGGDYYYFFFRWPSRTLASPWAMPSGHGSRRVRWSLVQTPCMRQGAGAGPTGVGGPGDAGPPSPTGGISRRALPNDHFV
jgi:hypothetical protein